ncbi:hypothetical protein SAMN02910276_02624 [Butyrivibrio sp. Su6]|uniref:DUF6240 domain-containing protein n=1 Tax=Butyrivibrio sp. Su6 TaxID=1520810 RepID=UPI00089F0F48|nr:DUF6240 domain-containing protein [Butyrivibrio sp. Su6]SEG35411.1 hypothetical protein SAMN02910276_02624 [Butyrivibrio sp. Su6]
MSLTFQTISDKRSANEQIIKSTEADNRIYTGSNRTEQTKANSFMVDLDSSFFSSDAYAQSTKSLDDVKNLAQNTDVQNKHNYMALLSNTMSDEDYAAVLEGGFDFGNLNSAETVTIMDKIKSVLLEAGTVIEGYNDDLSLDKLEKITGNRSFASALLKSFSENDIPITTKNVSEAKQAFEQISDIEKIDDSAVKYLVLNGKEPTINNIYLAQHSTNGQNANGRGFYAQDSYGYYAKKADNLDLEQVRPQIEKIVKESGLDESDETNIEQAKWTIEQGIPLTKENLEAVIDINEIEFPVTTELGAKAIAAALADGKAAKEANLHDPESSTKKLLTQRLQLEESRIKMSAEANSKMADKDFKIDLKPMEKFAELIKEELKGLSGELAGEVIDEKTQVNSENKAYIFSMTMTRVDIIKQGPADVTGAMLDHIETASLLEISSVSFDLTQKFRAAKEGYEKMETAPRADLGDGIKKAFRNVDEILTDLGKEISDENRRAIRILGYNSLEINEENFEKVRAYDLRLKETMDRLKPGAVLDLIRNGKNPLGMTIEELSKGLDQNEFGNNKNDSGKKSDEKYSKFLYKLEKNNGITKEERKTFIGIYRLFHTLKVNDHKAIGDLLKTGKEMTLGNLLDATRTQKKADRGIDYTVDDAFGGLDSINSAQGEKIDEQINSAFIFYKAHADIVYENLEPEKLKAANPKKNTLLTQLSQKLSESDIDEELEKAYTKENLRNIREVGASKETGAAIDEMETEQVELNFNNLEAMIENKRERKRGKLWDKASEIDGSIKKDEEDLLTLLDEDNYEDSYRQKLDQISEKLTEALMSTEDSYIDVKAITLMQKQISVMKKASGNADFDVPVEIEGTSVSMHVTLKSDDTLKTRMDASIQTYEYGLLTASLYEDGGSIKGMITTSMSESPEESEYLGNVKEKLCRKLSEKIKDLGVDQNQIGILYGVKVPQISSTVDAKAMDGERKITNTGTLLKMAKAFIEAL